VKRLVCALPLLGGKRRLVHEDVSVARRLQHNSSGPRVAREHDLSPRPGRAEHLLGRDRAPIRELDRLSVLQAAEQRALRDAEAFRSFHVEPARTRPLDERVAVG
jgi:hypothetical protein